MGVNITSIVQTAVIPSVAGELGRGVGGAAVPRLPIQERNEFTGLDVQVNAAIDGAVAIAEAHFA